jgi:hypothetical protein
MLAPYKFIKIIGINKNRSRMKKRDKIKAQLINESAELRQQCTELEAIATEHNLA